MQTINREKGLETLTILKHIGNPKWTCVECKGPEEVCDPKSTVWVKLYVVRLVVDPSRLTDKKGKKSGLTQVNKKYNNLKTFT